MNAKHWGAIGLVLLGPIAACDAPIFAQGDAAGGGGHAAASTGSGGSPSSSSSSSSSRSSSHSHGASAGSSGGAGGNGGGGDGGHASGSGSGSGGDEIGGGALGGGGGALGGGGDGGGGALGGGGAGGGGAVCASPGGTLGAGGGPSVMLIQDAQDGTVPTGTAITIEDVFVTSVMRTTSATFVVQAPDCRTKVGVEYPAFAGISVYASSLELATLPDAANAQVGDCVTVTGMTSEFHSGTELRLITSFTRAADPSSCGAPPTPLEVGPGKPVGFFQIASDGDGHGTVGAKAERYEFVLMRASSLQVTNAAVSSRVFLVTAIGQIAAAPNLRIDTQLTGPVAVTSGQTFQSITGIYEQYDQYELYPRTAGDLQ